MKIQGNNIRVWIKKYRLKQIYKCEFCGKRIIEGCEYNGLSICNKCGAILEKKENCLPGHRCSECYDPYAVKRREERLRR